MEAALDRGFTGYCRIARAAILLVFFGLAAAIGGLYFLGPMILTLRQPGLPLGGYLLGAVIIWHPTLLYLAALWFLQLAAAGLGRADAPEPRLARRLGFAGGLLVAGALAGAVSRPLLLTSDSFARLLAETNLHYPVWIANLFDGYVACAMIGLLGVLLVLVSRVLRQQMHAAEELRQIF